MRMVDNGPKGLGEKLGASSSGPESGSLVRRAATRGLDEGAKAESRPMVARVAEIMQSNKRHLVGIIAGKAASGPEDVGMASSRNSLDSSNIAEEARKRARDIRIVRSYKNNGIKSKHRIKEYFRNLLKRYRYSLRNDNISVNNINDKETSLRKISKLARYLWNDILSKIIVRSIIKQYKLYNNNVDIDYIQNKALEFKNKYSSKIIIELIDNIIPEYYRTYNNFKISFNVNDIVIDSNTNNVIKLSILVTNNKRNSNINNIDYIFKIELYNDNVNVIRNSNTCNIVYK